MSIDSIIDATIGKEGKYSNYPSDRGGKTNWGITIAVAREEGYSGSMKAMPRSAAFEIYKSRFFFKPRFDLVEAISPTVADELFDTGVNMGPRVPALWFQEWLNAFNRQQRDYPDIPEDAMEPKGGIGPRTIGAFNAFRKVRGVQADKVMLRGLNSSQGERYKQLARGRSANEDFVFGWLANRVGL